MGWESFDVVRFDLWPLFQGQMRIAKIKSAYNSLIRVPRGLQCHANLLEIMGYICVNHNTLYVTLQPCPVRGYTASRCNI